MNLLPRSKALRRDIVGVLEASRKGHIGAALSTVEVMQVLFDSFLRFRPTQPEWADRDRFILSKGHACVAVYAALAETGFFPREDLLKYGEHSLSHMIVDRVFDAAPRPFEGNDAAAEPPPPIVVMTLGAGKVEL
jgi:transketolase N-terminal domain/subunit